MGRAASILAITVAFVVAGVRATASAAAPLFRSVSAAAVVKRLPTLEWRVIAEVNRLRRARGLLPLRFNPELAVAAQGHSLSMAKRGYFSHLSVTGTPFWYRVKARYQAGGERRWRVGENLVWATPGLSAGKAIELWLESPPHRAIMLDPSWRDIGVGGVYARPAPGVYQGLPASIVTADFGVRTH